MTNLSVILLSLISLTLYSALSSGKPKVDTTDCTTIQDGVLFTSEGTVIDPGYNDWGYNYQAHIFNGYYCDAYRNAAWCQDFKDDGLSMKWNDAWLSKTDCDYDGLLDRHYGSPAYKGSGAWLTNHMSGTYIDDGGKNCSWIYFTKIVAVPTNATQVDNVWYDKSGEEIGGVIWGEFATVQTIYNDPCSGTTGVEYLSPVGPGFGKFKE